LDFLDKAEEIDAEVRQADFGFSAENLDISFDQSSKPDGMRDAAQAMSETSTSDAFSELARQVRQSGEQERLIIEAKKQYNTQFFIQFAFEGEGSSHLT
jgi:hypothetical protein